jgi:hypothetical protein
MDAVLASTTIDLPVVAAARLDFRHSWKAAGNRN